MIIFLIALGVLLFFFFRKWKDRKKITNNTMIGFVGGLGAGKTYMGVYCAKRAYRRSWLLWKIRRKILFFSKKERSKPEPQFLTNIPIRYRKGIFSKKIFSDVLTVDHLLEKTYIPPNSVLFVDELGQIASQYDYDNKFVMEDFQRFVRFFRHFVGRKHGRFVFTDQSISNVTLQIKRRVNCIYSLNDFGRMWFVLPFATVDVHELELVDETAEKVDELLLDDREFFLVPLPYPWQKRKRSYDTYAFSELYMKPEGTLPERWSSLKADGFLDIPFEKYKRR